MIWVFKDKPFSDLSRPISQVLHKSVNWLKTTATKIDPENNKVTLGNGNIISYDFLILATGAKMADEKILEKYNVNNICNFYTKEGVEKLRETIRNFDGGTIVISPTTVPYKCPPAPFEFAFLLDNYLRERGIRYKSTIKVLFPLSRTFTSKELSEKVENLFKKKNIKFFPFFNYESIDVENNKILSFEGEEIRYDELIIIPPHEGQDIIKESGLGDREGWVLTDRYSMKHTNYKNIYSIGDGTNLPISKSGAAAHFSAPALIKNILLEMKGKEPTKKYGGFTVCFVVTSFRRSMLLVFSYNYAPRKFGLHNLFLYGLFKKAFKIVYFKALIKGYL